MQIYENKFTQHRRANSLFTQRRRMRLVIIAYPLVNIIINLSLTSKLTLKKSQR